MKLSATGKRTRQGDERLTVAWERNGKPPEESYSATFRYENDCTDEHRSHSGTTFTAETEAGAVLRAAKAAKAFLKADRDATRTLPDAVVRMYMETKQLPLF